MVWKRRIGILAIVLLILAFLFFLVGVGLYYYVPDYVQNNIIPQLARQAGVNEISLKVRKIGITGADIGSLSVGSDFDAPALGVDSVRIDYSPWLLIGGKRISKIILSGVEINCGVRDGRFYLRGFDLDKFLKELKGSTATAESNKAGEPASFSVGLIEVRKADILFSWRGKTYRFPFRMKLHPDKNMKNFSVNLYAFPRGQKISVDGSFDIASGKSDLKFNSDSIVLSRFEDLFLFLKGAVMEGEASLSGSAQMTLEPFEIQKAEFDLKNKKALFSYEGLLFDNPLSNEGVRVPWSASLKGGGNVWNVSLSSIALSKPFPLKLDSLTSTFSCAGASCKVDGSCDISVSSSASGKGVPLFFNEQVSGSYAFSGAFDAASGKWSFSFGDTGKTAQEFSLKYAGADLELQKNPLKLQGEGELLKKGRINLETGANDLKISKGNALISSSESKIKADLKFLGDSKGHLMASSNIWLFLKDIKLKNDDNGAASIAGLKLDAKADFDNIDNRKLIFNAGFKDFRLSISSPKPFELNAPDLNLSGSLLGNRTEWSSLSCKLAFSELYAIFDSKVKFSNVSGTVPIEWPCKKSSKKGVLDVGNVSFENVDMGTLNASFFQKGAGCEFKARNNNNLIPGFSIDFKGSGEWNKDSGFSLGLDINSSDYKTQKPFDLGLLSPSLKGAAFDGEFSFNGALSLKGGSVNGSVNSKITDSRIEDEKKGIVIEKLNADISIQDILKLKSAPRQKISFLRASFGNLFVNDGKIDFQLESPKSIFIEKSSFKWCGGHLYTHAMRIVPGKDNYELTLFCDRIKLASLLEQFGVGKASGNGSVNGRIPLTFKDGKLDFKDGFLYSSPGDGGSIQLIAGNSLMSSVSEGISKSDPRFTQLELVQEALKDFEYDWAKLSLDTVKDELKIHMVFDGKPAKPLPFRYSKETGGWLRVDVGSEGSLFQGIKLDVNYKIPLSKLMGYGRSMKEIFNRIK